MDQVNFRSYYFPKHVENALEEIAHPNGLTKNEVIITVLEEFIKYWKDHPDKYPSYEKITNKITLQKSYVKGKFYFVKYLT